MRYLGGKSRTARQIAGYLNMIRKPGQPYWEPFVGAGWILERIRGTGPVFASDANRYLIAMWQALQAGWEPPGEVSEAEYQAIKAAPDSYPAELVAFVGFGCSFGGKWFAGYARSEKGTARADRYAGQSRRSIMQKITRIPDARFFAADFLTCTPPAPECLIYCDPPYEGQTDYGAVPDFNSGAFWRRVRELTNQGHNVFVSEYNAPDGFSEIVSVRTTTNLYTKNGKDPRTERLFRLGQHAPLQGALL